MNAETILKAYAENLYRSLPQPPPLGAQWLHFEIGNGVRLAAFFRAGGDRRALAAVLRTTARNVHALRTGCRLVRMFDAVEVSA